MPSLQGEMLLAATGVTAALRPGPIRINREVIARAQVEAVERAIWRKLSKFFRQPGFAPRETPPAFDYDEVMDWLPNAENEARNVENVSGFDAQDLADEYAGALGTAFGYVKREAPATTFGGVLNDRRYPPPDHAVSIWRRKYQVIDRPLIVLDDLNAGWLVDDQVAALKEIYPRLYAMIVDAVLPAMVDAASSKKSWRLPFAKDLQLGVLMQSGNLDGGLHGQLLETWEKRRAEESDASNGKVPSPPPSKRVGDATTHIERMEAK